MMPNAMEKTTSSMCDGGADGVDVALISQNRMELLGYGIEIFPFRKEKKEWSTSMKPNPPSKRATTSSIPRTIRPEDDSNWPLVGGRIVVYCRDFSDRGYELEA